MNKTEREGKDPNKEDCTCHLNERKRKGSLQETIKFMKCYNDFLRDVIEKVVSEIPRLGCFPEEKNENVPFK